MTLFLSVLRRDNKFIFFRSNYFSVSFLYSSKRSKLRPLLCFDLCFFCFSFPFIRLEYAIMKYFYIILNNLLVLGLLMSKCHNFFCRKNFTCTFIEWKKKIPQHANSNLLLLCPLFVGELMVGCTAFAITVIYPERQNSNYLIKLIYCFNKF